MEHTLTVIINRLCYRRHDILDDWLQDPPLIYYSQEDWERFISAKWVYPNGDYRNKGSLDTLRSIRNAILDEFSHQPHISQLIQAIITIEYTPQNAPFLFPIHHALQHTNTFKVILNDYECNLCCELKTHFKGCEECRNIIGCVNCSSQLKKCPYCRNLL